VGTTVWDESAMSAGLLHIATCREIQSMTLTLMRSCCHTKWYCFNL